MDCVATDVWHRAAGLMGNTQPACTSMASRCRANVTIMHGRYRRRHDVRAEIPRGENLAWPARLLLYKQQCYSGKSLYFGKFSISDRRGRYAPMLHNQLMN